jgi:putative ABC transport system permease protein
MIRNFIRSAWRSLLKNRLSAGINIGGLSVGMAVAMLIACWIYTEWSFDRQFDNGEEFENGIIFQDLLL